MRIHLLFLGENRPGVCLPTGGVQSKHLWRPLLISLFSTSGKIFIIKLYDGDSYGVPYVVKGFNQAAQYVQDYGKTFAYLLTMNLSEHNLHLPSDEDLQIWPPRLHIAGVTVYMVVVRAKPLSSASRRGKQTTKQISRGASEYIGSLLISMNYKTRSICTITINSTGDADYCVLP